MRILPMTLLCIRFSAIGDVAMTVPVVKALALAHPDLRIIMVSRPFAAAFFEGLAPNVEFVAMDLKQQRYQGTMGVEHVYQDLRALNPDMVADLHDVIRTKYARLRFRMAGIPVSYIDKNRKGRKELTRPEAKVMTQQLTSFEKYAKVLKNLGLELPDMDETVSQKVIETDSSCLASVAENMPFLADKANVNIIGIAPFAGYESKIYPIEKMEQVVSALLSSHPGLRILLFGGGKRDRAVFDEWCRKYENVVFASEKCHGMREELAVMEQLDCMVSMDSGNMHLASLVGTPVVSVWGATHPCAGFMGWGQSDDDAVQVSLPCRPCSIYGKKLCMRDDFACMNMITPGDIVRKVEKYLI